ncbi:MAG: fibronectin type III domain-containing protein [Acidobacteria bacterium]|nr:fibronectin type III domain-containing protein [Acidobacteriota bacterium]
MNTSSAGLADSAWPKFHHDNRNTGLNVPLPPAPTGLGYNAGARTVALFWVAPESGTAVGSYVIEVASKPEMSDWASIDTGGRDTTFIFQTSGAFGQVYYIRVRAKGIAGVGPPSRALIVNPGTDARRRR